MKIILSKATQLTPMIIDAYLVDCLREGQKSVKTRNFLATPFTFAFVKLSRRPLSFLIHRPDQLSRSTKKVVLNEESY